jgi:N-acetyl sugar amidotransferase
MRICKQCIQPDTRPNIYFNDEGICGACLWEEEIKSIDWNSRRKELQGIADWAKNNTKSNYDCVIGVSGGKDSTFQAITARDELGLRCLLVNGEPEGITNIGRYNIENLKKLGFDVISLRPNPKITKKLVKYDFYKHGNPFKATEFSLWASAYIIADNFDIPLIIQGENAALTLGVSKGDLSKNYNALEANKQNTQALGWKEYLDVDDVEEKDLFMFHYDNENLKKKEIKGIWLQYFVKEWSANHNAEFAKKYGLKFRPKDFDPATIGTYVPYAQLDVDLIHVAQLLKYIKFGFGQCMDYACYDFREGKITRNEAIDLVEKYDGKCAEEYIQKFCDWIEIPLDEFWKISNSFRGPMWIKKGKGEWHNTFWDILE